MEQALTDAVGVQRLANIPEVGGDGAVLEADLRLDAADDLVATLGRLGVPSEDFVLSHLEVVAPVPAAQSRIAGGDAFAWIEVLGRRASTPGRSPATSS